MFPFSCVVRQRLTSLEVSKGVVDRVVGVRHQFLDCIVQKVHPLLLEGFTTNVSFFYFLKV